MYPMTGQVMRTLEVCLCGRMRSLLSVEETGEGMDASVRNMVILLKFMSNRDDARKFVRILRHAGLKLYI